MGAKTDFHARARASFLPWSAGADALSQNDNRGSYTVRVLGIRRDEIPAAEPGP